MWEALFWIIFIICVFSFFSIAPWVPTNKNDLEKIWKIIQLNDDEKFLEIGCGTARVSLYLAKKYPQAQIYGIELSPLFFLISYIKAKFSGQKNITILYWNALKVDFSQYDIIYIFGLPEILEKTFAPKLEQELKKNARFYSYTFQMKNTNLQETKYKEEWMHSLYKYQK